MKKALYTAKEHRKTNPTNIFLFSCDT